MKVLEINSVCGIRSTGRICTDIADVLHASGHTCRIGYGRNQALEAYRDIAIRIGSQKDCLLHAAGARLLDNAGFLSKNATESFLREVDDYAPDIIHLHNIHGYYLHVGLLFAYIKQKGIPVVWTLHDCWAFTGHCSHFSAIGCEKWTTGCYACPLKKEYPSSAFLDASRRNYRKKKELFSGVPHLTIVTPSAWLASCVQRSFLQGYPIRVIPNGIDRMVFRPTESDFRKRYGLEDKNIVLGVATAWTVHKGLPHFLQLADKLGSRYQVVLVGLTAQQIRALPDNVLGIERTNSAAELAAIYSASDVLVSMSSEETMGLTVVEANACGIPAIVFEKTALPEIVTDKTGLVLTDCSADGVAKALHERDVRASFQAADCIRHAEGFDKAAMYKKYLDIYGEVGA